MQDDVRLAEMAGHDLDIGEEEAAHACPQGLGHGFLGGETLGQAEIRARRRQALTLFVGRVHAVEEARAEAFVRFLDAAGIAQIDAYAQDHAALRRASSIRSRMRPTAASNPTKIASPIRK